jgi:hypothetical protein
MIMTIEQIIQQINTERLVGSRFPVRLIFVENLSQYEDLIARLGKLCDATVNLSDEDICTGADIYPNFNKLREKLLLESGKHILLLSVGEYLRMRIKREIVASEAKFPSFWQLQQDAASKTRVFVPMFACRDLFDRVVPQIDDRQKDYIWTIDAPLDIRPTYHVSVYSPAFGKALPSAINGIRKWLSCWQDEYKKNKPIELITALNANIEKTNGEININVIDNAFDYLCSLVQDGARLKREWAQDNVWVELIPHVVRNQPFNKTIETVLNVQSFSSLPVMAMWDTFSSLQRIMVWIWYQINESDDYCGYVFRHTQKFDEVKSNIRDMVVKCISRPEWIDERNRLLQALNNIAYDDKYFAMLDTLPLPDTRLKLLTYVSHAEHTYAIKTISQWLQQGASIEGVLESLAGRYALLEQYLSEGFPGNTVLSKYFAEYRRHKVMNRIPQGGLPSVDLDAYPSRYSLLNQYQGKDCIAFWVDGMGVEWLPLLLKLLNNSCSNATIDYEIATAILPTETEFNEQWNDFDYPYEKWDRLDILAHKGSPDDKDYYSCIAHQLMIIAEVAAHAKLLLDEHNYVIITANHGSSRIAALSFHNTPGIPVPKKAIVRSYGRFCELHEAANITDILPCTRIVKNDNVKFMVMTTHEHYAVSGNAAGGNDDNNAIAGEIHGGMTPEEYLVPVVVLKRRVPLTPLDYTVTSNLVYREKGNAKIELCFSREVLSLEVTADTIKGHCEPKSSKEWVVFLNGVDIREYELEVIANKRLIRRKERITIKAKGISKNDDLFGGL